jgi:hypothetical protein
MVDEIKKAISEHLFNDANKEKIVAALNEKINIPIIGEKTEAKIIGTVYDVIEEVIKKEILK